MKNAVTDCIGLSQHFYICAPGGWLPSITRFNIDKKHRIKNIVANGVNSATYAEKSYGFMITAAPWRSLRGSSRSGSVSSSY